MRLKTFRAKTMGDALASVKKDLGKDAVILHTRTVKVGGIWGFGARPMVEVIASDEVRVVPPTFRNRQTSSEPAAEPATPAAVPSRASRAAAASAYRQGAGISAAAGSMMAAAPSPARTPSTPPVPAASPAPVAAAVSSIEPAVTAVAEAPAPAPNQTLQVRQRGPWTTASSDPDSRRRLATPVALAPTDGSAVALLHDDLAAIKRMVGQVLQQSSPSPAAGMMPEALFRQYLKLIEGQVAREAADLIVGAVRDELTPGELSDESIVRQTVLRHLASMIPVAESITPAGRTADGRPLTIALVGPTGVGKTTTIAKLAATYKLRYGKRVGLITSDTYRIAAVEQLRTYANIISVPLKVALTPAEMSAACDSMSDCDAILIDTAGRSQHDSARLDELRSFIDAASPHETHLVLSSTASEHVLLRTAAQFRVTRPNRLIITKLDEAVNFGVLVNVARNVDAKLSFVTTGQEVPDQIEPGHPDRLARLILDGELMP